MHQYLWFQLLGCPLDVLEKALTHKSIEARGEKVSLMSNFIYVSKKIDSYSFMPFL